MSLLDQILHPSVSYLLCCQQAPSPDVAISELTNASAEVSGIVFFLLGAMTIVEIVDAHQGFKLVTDNITTRKPRLLLWVVSADLHIAGHTFESNSLVVNGWYARHIIKLAEKTIFSCWFWFNIELPKFSDIALLSQISISGI